MLSKVFKDCFTEADNSTFDIVRILGALSLLMFLILAAIELIKHCKDFSLSEVATGVAMILASIGAGVGYKYGKEKANTNA